MNLIQSISSIKWWLIGGTAAIALLSVGSIAVYSKGYSAGEAVSAQVISTYETKIRDLSADLAKKQNTVTRDVVTKYVDKVIYRDRIVYKNRDVVITSVPEQYTLSRGWVYAHNQSALGLPIDPALAADATPSETTDKEALSTIDKNNAEAIANADRLDALQEWVLRIEKTYPNR